MNKKTINQVKQDTPFLQGHWDFFHGGCPQSKDKEYMRGYSKARRKNLEMIARKEKKRRG